VFPVVRVGLAAVVAAGVLAAGGCSPAPVCACQPPPLPFTLTFTTTIGGRTAAVSTGGHPPSFDVRPGHSLEIDVVVTVPKRARVSALWLGISTGAIGSSQENRRPLLDPVLAHPHGVLVAGSYTFRMQWRVPAKAKHGRPPYLVANWATRQAQTASVAEFVARLVVHRVARS